MRIEPFTLQDLDGLAELEPADWEAALARLRWHVGTPYAFAIKSLFGEALMSGLGTAVAHNGSGWIGDVLMMPHFQGPGLGSLLLKGLMQGLKARGCNTITALVPKAARPLFGAHGFVHECDYLCYAGGTSGPPTLDEVVLCGPEHTMGILHLDRTVTGEDRRTLIIEHLHAGRVYVERGRVRGTYLPLLGAGLLQADRPDVGEELLRWHLPYVQAHCVPEANRVAAEYMQLRGYTVQGRLHRMRHGNELPWRPALNYGWISERLG